MPQLRLSRRIAFWLGCFAMLMMQLGPVISGVQAVMAGSALQTDMQPYLLEEQGVKLADARQDHADHDHHALMGHTPNPHLPDWANNLKMCGYCELLTLSPALLLALVFALPLLAARLLSVTWKAPDIPSPRLRLHAAPRAPPLSA